MKSPRASVATLFGSMPARNSRTVSSDAVSISETVSLQELATYACFPSADSDIPLGVFPTGIRRITFPVFASTTATSPDVSQTTNRRDPSLVTAISMGDRYLASVTEPVTGAASRAAVERLGMPRRAVEP
jgi:hypothetical protein